MIEKLDVEELKQKTPKNSWFKSMWEEEGFSC